MPVRQPDPASMAGAKPLPAPVAHAHVNAIATGARVKADAVPDAGPRMQSAGSGKLVMGVRKRHRGESWAAGEWLWFGVQVPLRPPVRPCPRWSADTGTVTTLCGDEVIGRHPRRQTVEPKLAPGKRRAYRQVVSNCRHASRDADSRPKSFAANRFARREDFFTKSPACRKRALTAAAQIRRS